MWTNLVTYYSKTQQEAEIKKSACYNYDLTLSLPVLLLVSVILSLLLVVAVMVVVTVGECSVRT